MRPLHALLPAAVLGCLLVPPAARAADGEDTPLDLSDQAVDAAAQGASGGSIVRTIVGLAIVLAVIYGLYWVLKQVKAAKHATAAGDGLETLATLPLGTNRALHLVRAGREVVLLGTADNAVAPIRRYSEDEARALGLIDPQGATLASLDDPEPRRTGLLEALRSKTVIR